MSRVSVYIEGAKDTSAPGLKRLAACIADRYSLSAPDLEKRLAGGRFRVKANVDEATARAFAADLEMLGARCEVVTMDNPQPPLAVTFPPSSGTTSLSGATDGLFVPATHEQGSRPTSSVSTSRTTTIPMAGLLGTANPTKPPANGLIAALADVTYAGHGLNALDADTFSLTTIDGKDVVRPPATDESRLHVGPHSSQVQETLQVVGRPPPLAHAETAIDLFAPPPQSDAAEVDLVAEVRPRRGSLAPEGAPMTASAIAPMLPKVIRPTSSPLQHQKLRERAWFACGIFLSVLLGFVPAHLVARDRERTAFEEIDNHVRAAQSEISTLAEWNALDDIRTARLRQKHGAHQGIVFLSLLMWIGISSGLSVAWVRVAMPRITLGLRARQL
jgi:hypothetical protein